MSSTTGAGAQTSWKMPTATRSVIPLEEMIHPGADPPAKIAATGSSQFYRRHCSTKTSSRSGGHTTKADDGMLGAQQCPQQVSPRILVNYFEHLYCFVIKHYNFNISSKTGTVTTGSGRVISTSFFAPRPSM